MPTKEYILSLNEGRPTAERFIIQDLDDTRLFVQPTVVDWLEQRLKEFHEQVCSIAWRFACAVSGASQADVCLLECRTLTSRPAARTQPNRAPSMQR